MSHLHRFTTAVARARRAFSLIELAVVLIVVGVIAAIAIPTFQAVIERSKVAAEESSQAAIARDVAAILAFQDGTSPSEALDIALGEVGGARSAGVLAADSRYTRTAATVASTGPGFVSVSADSTSVAWAVSVTTNGGVKCRVSSDPATAGCWRAKTTFTGTSAAAGPDADDEDLNLDDDGEGPVVVTTTVPASTSTTTTTVPATTTTVPATTTTVPSGLATRPWSNADVENPAGLIDFVGRGLSTSNPYVVGAGVTLTNGGYSPETPVDHSTGTEGLRFGNAWWQVDFGARKVSATEFLIVMSEFDAETVVEGSNDAETWTTLWTAPYAASDVEQFRATSSSSTPFRYLRVTRPSGSSFWGLTEFEVYGTLHDS